MSEAQQLAIYYVEDDDPRLLDLIDNSSMNPNEWAYVLENTMDIVDKDTFENILYDTDIDIYPDILNYLYDLAVSRGREDLLSSFE